MRVICFHIKPLAVGCKEKVNAEFGHLEELLRNGKMAKVGASSKRGQLLDKVWVKFSIIFNQSNQVEVSTLAS